MSEFDYKQRSPDNRKEFERRWERVFGSDNLEGDLKEGIYKEYSKSDNKPQSKTQPSLKD